MTFYTEFGGISNADYEAVAYLLIDSCEKYPDFRLLSERCAELYDANVDSNTDFFGDMRATTVSISAIDDRYALEGEKLEQEACALLLECILHPRTKSGVFDDTAVRIAASEITDAILAKVNDKRQLALVNACKTAYVGEPYSKLIEGTVEEAGQITPESAWRAYCEMIERGHIEIIAAGCSDFADCERALTEAFSNVNRHDVFIPQVKPSVLKSEPRYVQDKIPMQQAIIRMYFKAPDFNDRIACSMLSLILGGMPTSRFFLNIREKQSLCYYCSSVSAFQKRTLIAYAGVEPKNVKRTQEAIIHELNAVAEGGVTEEELTHARLELLNAIPTLYDSPFALASWFVNQMLFDKTLTPEEYMDEVNSCTAERIQAAAKAMTLDTVYTLESEVDN